MPKILAIEGFKINFVPESFVARIQKGNEIVDIQVV
jgi:hypothetical protein